MSPVFEIASSGGVALNKIDKALAKLKLSPPATFTPAPGPIHADIQRAFACDLLRDGPLKASFRGGWEVQLYRPSLGAPRGAKRQWLSLGEYDGGNYNVFVFDFGSPDPKVYRFDHEDFDEASDAPRSFIQLAPSLSSFLGALRPESPPKRAVEQTPPHSSVDLGFIASKAALAGDRLLAVVEQRLVIFERRGEAWIIQLDTPIPWVPWSVAFDGDIFALEDNDHVLVGRRDD